MNIDNFSTESLGRGDGLTLVNSVTTEVTAVQNKLVSFFGTFESSADPNYLQQKIKRANDQLLAIEKAAVTELKGLIPVSNVKERLQDRCQELLSVWGKEGPFYNEIIEALPSHLRSYIKPQNYEAYTAENHEVWRYIMRRLTHHLRQVAHPKYLEGLQLTGVTVDDIPNMYGMNRILKDQGWAAAAVDGFIPPAAFMELQAHGVLPIAEDMRPSDQILYTPAPDITHESAGHAPFIAIKEFAAYLKRVGEVGSKAISSTDDYRHYELIRHLSIISADPKTSVEEREQARVELEQFEEYLKDRPPSEMKKIRALHWWTVELGLIGKPDDYKLFGAALLSSIGESINCMNDQKVPKIPYSVAATEVNFDITNEQPQLFVARDWQHLNQVLEEFADTMAWRRGGLHGLNLAINSKDICTYEYDTGLQISGNIQQVITDADGKEPIYVCTTGPTSLAVQNKILDGYGPDRCVNGFGSPVGPVANCTETDGVWQFELKSGVVIKGKIIDREDSSQDTANRLLVLEDCTVEFEEKTLFSPQQGQYIMALGESITSVFGGAADPVGHGIQSEVPAEKTHKIEYTADDYNHHALFATLRDYRQNPIGSEQLLTLWQKVQQHFPNDWLIPLGIYEILKSNRYPVLDDDLADKIRAYLEHLAEQGQLAELIYPGLQLIDEDYNVID